jgi:hypothetical protein
MSDITIIPPAKHLPKAPQEMHLRIVSERTIIDRLNRKLAKKGWRVHKTRVAMYHPDWLGWYYIEDSEGMCAKGLDTKALIRLSREEGALKDSEKPPEYMRG